MTKNDILAYITETPTNTNRAVLSHMLDSFESGDNKQEIELLAQENKVYTPAEGKVYNKVTVNVPAPPSTAEVIMPAQYVTITDADVEVTDVDMSSLENREKLLFEVLVEGVYEEQVSFTIKYGDGEAHTDTNEMIGITEGGLHITVKKTDDVWKLKVTDGSGSTYIPGSYIIKIIKIDILDAISAYPREETEG